MKCFALALCAGLIATSTAFAQRNLTYNTGANPADRPAANPAGNSGLVVVRHCSVDPLSVRGQSRVPAQEAGVLLQINVEEGARVQAGQELAAIDDNQAQKQKRVAAAEHRAAKERAENDVNIRHGEMAAKVAENEYRINWNAVHGEGGVRGAVSDIELKKLEFEHKKMILAIEQARKEQIVDGFTAEAKLAEMEAADEAIQRRRIKSPIDGIVEDITFNEGDWVKPGDMVFHILRLDRLRVEGHIPHTEASPSQLMGKPVIVEVELAGGQKAEFRGQVKFIASEVDSAGQRVCAEVENRQDAQGQWLLRPGIGMSPTMTISLR